MKTLTRSSQELISQKSEIFYTYWIHLESHRDVTKQGYVGITKQSVKDRYYKHCHDATKSKLNYPVSRAIRKYGGESLIVDTLCISDEDYAKQLENKLRPFPRIGWNIVEGGQDGNADFMKLKWQEPAHKDKVSRSLRKYHTEETRKACSERFKNMHKNPNSKINTEEYKANRKEMVLGWINKPEVMEKRSKSISKARKERQESIGPWSHPRTNHEIWSIADQIFNEWFKGHGNVGHKTLARKFNFEVGSLITVVNHFRQGWQPRSDKRWLDYYIKE